MSIRRHFADDRGEPICGRVPAAVARMAEAAEEVTCASCRSALASRDERTQLRPGDFVMVGDDPTERSIGRYLTRGPSGRDYSQTRYTLCPIVEGGTWGWADYRQLTLVRRGPGSRLCEVER